MNYLKKYLDKLYLKQWNIGFVKGNMTMEDIIRQKKQNLSFEWMLLDNKYLSHADPFIFKAGDGLTGMLFEDFTTHQYDGKISLAILDKSLKPVFTKVVLEMDNHLSYPYIFWEKDKMYVFPEAAQSGSLFCYEYDAASKSLVNKREIMRLPVIDPTIIKYNNKYWLFGTLLSQDHNSKLHIFYSDNLLGPYLPHANNPVKDSVTSVRPAGSMVEVDGNLYRPAQNCENYYGASITINKITMLSETDFREEKYMELFPDKNDIVNYGLHTINVVDNTIVVDGLRKYARPWQQLKKILKSKINK